MFYFIFRPSRRPSCRPLPPRATLDLKLDEMFCFNCCRSQSFHEATFVDVTTYVGGSMQLRQKRAETYGQLRTPKDCPAAWSSGGYYTACGPSISGRD